MIHSAAAAPSDDRPARPQREADRGRTGQDEVFDTGLGKLILLSHGTQRVEQPDISTKVSIEWDGSLTRVNK